MPSWWRRWALLRLRGQLALSLIAIPVVVRTTENMLRLVPGSLREAAAALGAPRWKVSTMVTLRAAKSGVITGLLLAIARISGETAPLLFTALNNQFFSTNMSQPMANLPVVIFQFAMSPYDNWIRLAWGGALLITLTVLVLNIVARVFFREKIGRPLSARPYRLKNSTRIHHGYCIFLNGVQCKPACAAMARTRSAWHWSAQPRLLLRQWFQGLKNVNLTSRAQGDGLHRPVGLRQVDAAAHAQPHVQPVPGPARRGRDPFLRQNILDPKQDVNLLRAQHRHGVPEADAVSR
jgi:hypothetical protein